MQPGNPNASDQEGETRFGAAQRVYERVRCVGRGWRGHLRATRQRKQRR